MSFLVDAIFFFFFFFNDTATTEIYTLSLHDALPIFAGQRVLIAKPRIDNRYDIGHVVSHAGAKMRAVAVSRRSEEHTSELQSHVNLVCRLLLEKKKKKKTKQNNRTTTPTAKSHITNN